MFALHCDLGPSWRNRVLVHVFVPLNGDNFVSQSPYWEHSQLLRPEITPCSWWKSRRGPRGPRTHHSLSLVALSAGVLGGGGYKFLEQLLVDGRPFPLKLESQAPPTQPYPTQHHPTQLHPTPPNTTPHHTTQPNSTQHHPTPHHPTQLHPTPPNPTPPNPTPPHTTQSRKILDPRWQGEKKNLRRMRCPNDVSILQSPCRVWQEPRVFVSVAPFTYEFSALRCQELGTTGCSE